MLTLSGGPPGGGISGAASPGSPVLGAMMELDPANAYSIMSFMSIKVCALWRAAVDARASRRGRACPSPATRGASQGPGLRLAAALPPPPAIVAGLPQHTTPVLLNQQHTHIHAHTHTSHRTAGQGGTAGDD
jgi:hypothetical protein